MLYLNGVAITPTLFPDNTSQVWKLPEHLLSGDIAWVTWEFEHEGELMHLAQLKDLIDGGYNKYNLHMPFLPYARQDKILSNYSTFALRTFSHLINMMRFDGVNSLDVHSDVAHQFIINFGNESPIQEVGRIVQEVNPSLLCFPDEGARNRYDNMIGLRELASVYGTKARDPETGYIRYTNIGGAVNAIAGSSILIVDDICDGGMTFKLLTKLLEPFCPKEVHLYTTHGIFSKGLRTLRESGINRIFTRLGEASEVQGNICYKEL